MKKSQDTIVDVLLAIYKEPLDLVEKSISSILSQNKIAVKIILIVDNPFYSSIDYIKGLGKNENITVIINDVNMGLAKSLNIGIESSTAKYIARMDADDVSDPERLNSQLKYLVNNNLDLIGCSVNKINIDGDRIGKMHSVDDHEISTTILKYKTFMFHPTWFGRSEVFKVIKYRNFTYAQDVDFLHRTILNGYRLGNCPDFLLDFRVAEEEHINCIKIYRQYLFRHFSYKENTGRANDFDVEKCLSYISQDTPSYRFEVACKFFLGSISSRKITVKLAKLSAAFFLHNYAREQVYYKLFSFIKKVQLK
ncbi:glycosyltransferase [Vibrio splendidus]|uniref:glycosyltransferase n=1 Tax=Vibrio splendidus TaxID=29497 RepID=UPI000D338D05|nr:glycosyltransferase [Vibrio splendidus]PTP29383.1 hypothetical protein CWN92_11755 [Vibrio splendidus]